MVTDYGEETAGLATTLIISYRPRNDSGAGSRRIN